MGKNHLSVLKKVGLILCIALILVSCSLPSNLTNREQELVGMWETAPRDSGGGTADKNFLHFKENRKGEDGAYYQIGNKKTISDFFTNQIQEWFIKGDSLFVISKMDEAWEVKDSSGIVLGRMEGFDVKRSYKIEHFTVDQMVLTYRDPYFHDIVEVTYYRAINWE